ALPPHRNRRLNPLFVQYLKQRHLRLTASRQLLQQAVSLGDQLFVAGQMIYVSGADLPDLRIDEPAPDLRASLDDIQVLRGEQDDGQGADVFAEAALFHSVADNLFSPFRKTNLQAVG